MWYGCCMAGASYSYCNIAPQVMFIWHTVHAMAALNQHNYSRYRFANIYIRLQVRCFYFTMVRNPTPVHGTQLREGLVVFAAIIIMQAVIVYIHPSVCASQFIETLGIAPLQFLLSVMLLARSWYAAPVTQQPHQLLMSEKQQFAWCESDLARMMAQRGCADTEPMFCYESALKALFWTIAAYRETQVRRTVLQALRSCTIPYLYTGYSCRRAGVHRHQRAQFAANGWSPH